MVAPAVAVLLRGKPQVSCRLLISCGPSPVINNTVRGVIETARDLDGIGTVYGALPVE